MKQVFSFIFLSLFISSLVYGDLCACSNCHSEINFQKETSSESGGGMPCHGREFVSKDTTLQSQNDAGHARSAGLKKDKKSSSLETPCCHLGRGNNPSPFVKFSFSSFSSSGNAFSKNQKDPTDKDIRGLFSFNSFKGMLSSFPFLSSPFLFKKRKDSLGVKKALRQRIHLLFRVLLN